MHHVHIWEKSYLRLVSSQGLYASQEGAVASPDLVLRRMPNAAGPPPARAHLTLHPWQAQQERKAGHQPWQMPHVLQC